MIYEVDFLDPTISDWNNKDLLTDYSIAANRVIEIFGCNLDISTEKYMGVRTNGSSLERKFQIHESEGTGRDGLTMCVKSDGSGIIEVYTVGEATYYVLGYFSALMGYTERMSSDLVATTDDVWDDESLSGIVTASMMAEMICLNIYASAEYNVGVRANGSSNDRYVLLHEAEGGGVTGVRLLALADASSIIEIYEDSKAQNTIYCIGFFTILISYKVEGVTKDSSGTPLGSCTVDLFDADDESKVDSVISDSETGAYIFTGLAKQSPYYLRAFKSGSPDVMGTTPRTVVGVEE